MTTEAKLARVLTTLKSIEAGLMTLAQQHHDPQARQVFGEQIAPIRRIAERLARRYRQVLREEPEYVGLSGSSGKSHQQPSQQPHHPPQQGPSARSPRAQRLESGGNGRRLKS